MSRATLVYLLMIVVLVAGLWAILALGGRLRAPEDLRGQWTTVEPGSGWSGLNVDQSGRYFELAFANGPTFGVTAADPANDGSVSMDRKPWHVTLDGPDPAHPDVRTFHVAGPTVGTFVGRRASPTTAPAKEAK